MVIVTPNMDGITAAAMHVVGTVAMESAGIAVDTAQICLE
jgi:hypothetical protein